METTWTWGQLAPGDRNIQSDVQLTADAFRPDFVFLRQENTSGRTAGTLKKLWGLLTEHAVCQFKSVGRPYRPFDFDRFFACVVAYFTDHVEQVHQRSEVCGVLLVMKRSKPLDEDVQAYGLRWRDLGDGYWQLEGGPFKLVVVEIEVVADAEDDDVLGFLARRQPRTVEGRSWLAKQLGTAEMQMKMHEMEGFDDVLQTFLASLTPEQRVAGLAPEQVVLTLPDDVLRALSDSYIDSLAEPTRTIIRKRLGR